jgi:hypothetical protein
MRESCSTVRDCLRVTEIGRHASAPSRCARARKGEGEGASFSDGAVRPYPSAVRADDTSRNEDAESQSLSIPAASLRKTLEDRLHPFGWDAGSGVGHGKANLVGPVFGTDAHVTGLRSEFQGVRQQVSEHLEDALVIEARRDRLAASSPVCIAPRR